MRGRRVAAVSVAAVAGAAFVATHRLRDASANIRRYSMPSAGAYDLVTGLVFGRRYDEIAREVAAEAPEGGTVVDLGCGPGEVLVRVARLAPSLRLTGVDVDPGMIARARRKAGQRLGGATLRTPEYLVADAAALPFADESVDLLISSYAVHHLPDRDAARTEILRVLKPGARAIIWDVVSPHGAPAQGPADASSHGHPGPQAHDSGAVAAVRMFLRFGRMPAERYEIRKADHQTGTERE